MDSRPPPPQGAPPSYAFVTRVYRKNLRPIVITFAFLAGLWALFSGIGFFRNANIYGRNDQTKLQLFNIIIGALYMVVLGIELFGLYASTTQKAPMVRIFAWLSLLVVLVIAAVGLIRSVIHFTLKSSILDTCTSANTGDTVFFTSFWGPISGGTLSQQDARDWCNRAYDRDSWSEILGLLTTTGIAAFFASVNFAFFRQVLDPTSPANMLREPGAQRNGAFPTHYNPPYGGGGGYGAPPNPNYFPSYAPPAGPPPGRQNTDAFVPPYAAGPNAEGKPPGYVRGDDYNGPGFDSTKKSLERHEEEGQGYGWAAQRDGPSERDVTSRNNANPFL
ncbi:hypothetical protein D9619_010065 [Psilocybe cf. subviscida]|uniref:Uncharacterized protein n=1 Tax=Psilocybe cf. subviscida TaxID=2480587 RepID=A0A8H5BLB5_9AGAR|nr:hypothetical protein D9619_010065 [Psilocybe cf. subviscida]